MEILKMEMNDILALIEKNAQKVNDDLGFKKCNSVDNSLCYYSDNGAYRVRFDQGKSLVFIEFSYDFDVNDKDAEFSVESKNLFDLEKADDRDVKSLTNEVIDEVKSKFAKNKKVDVQKIKIPKAIAKSKAKSGALSYDVNSLANKFGVLYPEYKDDIRENIAKYGEFLPETFFKEIGTPKVLSVIKNGTKEERNKLFKMLNEIYEDGTNEVQDIIGVSILGEMRNDKAMMKVAEEYMSDYMAGPVREINKVMGRKNSLTRKLDNPPAYKPKKKKSFMSDALQAQQNV